MIYQEHSKDFAILTIPRLLMIYNYSILQKGVDRNSLKNSLGESFIWGGGVGAKQMNSEAVNCILTAIPFTRDTDTGTCCRAFFLH